MVEFNNGKNGGTPINADNLNHNFDELYNKPIYYAQGETEGNIEAYNTETIYAITLPAGVYIGKINVRNQGGGNTPFRTFIFFDDGTNTYVDNNFVSLDWGSNAVPVILNLENETTIYGRVEHDSETAHKIDGFVQLIKIK